MIGSRAGERQPVMRCVTHTLNGEFDDDDDDDDDDDEDEDEGTPWLWITDLSFYLGGSSRGQCASLPTDRHTTRQTNERTNLVRHTDDVANWTPHEGDEVRCVARNIVNQ